MDMGKLYPLSFIPNALSVTYWFINYLNKVLYILSYEFLSNVGMTSEAGTGDGLKKDPDKSFAIFTGKHLHQSLFFSKVAGPSLQLYQKKILRCRYFIVFKNTYFAECLPTTGSVELYLLFLLSIH